MEGLLASFAKLLDTSKQHTFLETESVRYVYQPLEKFYMLLITTKASNILEDMATLRLFSRVVSYFNYISDLFLYKICSKVLEYCESVNEKQICEHSFDLIFAFDEIVALGYRENVNLDQIRAYTDMESNEEKIFNAMRLAKQKEASLKMLEKAKELQRIKIEAKKTDLFKNDSIGSTISNYDTV